jgi:hypothetical protein
MVKVSRYNSYKKGDGRQKVTDTTDTTDDMRGAAAIAAEPE